ncbi:MAG: hypothetical protein ACLFN8_03190 [Candidatus Woesearchaeota archaeon]
MNNKKAQIQQVFTYLMAILIIGAILLLGVRSIGNIQGKACDVDEVTFKRDLENLMSKHANTGNIGYEQIRVPCDYDYLCFTNHTQTNCAFNDIEELTAEQKQIMVQECNVGTGNNVFITQGNTLTPLFSIENLQTKESFCLEPKSNRYHMKFEGVGRRQVLITPDTR